MENGRKRTFGTKFGTRGKGKKKRSRVGPRFFFLVNWGSWGVEDKRAQKREKTVGTGPSKWTMVQVRKVVGKKPPNSGPTDCSRKKKGRNKKAGKKKGGKSLGGETGQRKRRQPAPGRIYRGLVW